MKRFLLVFIAFCGMLTASAQENSLKVVVTKDGDVVGRYVRQTATTYIANPLDWEEEVSKKTHRVEVWTPEKGKGVVARRDGVTGNINVRKGPSTRTAVVCQIKEEDCDSDLPVCTYDCLGKTKGWYKIRVKGKVGYVREDLVTWAAYFAD